jgi:hypothetical protein
MLNDAAIRTAVHREHLSGTRKSAKTLIVNELGIDHGKMRADIAVINARFTGYEIKSDEDSLSRLPRQITGYNRVFDYAHIVATDRHLEKAMAMVPNWWGVIRVWKDTQGDLRTRTVRKGSLNPKRSSIALARLLWRDEVLTILKELGMSGASLRRERAKLYRSLVQRLSMDDLALLVTKCFRSRAAWRDHSQPFPDGGSSQRSATL